MSKFTNKGVYNVVLILAESNLTLTHKQGYNVDNAILMGCTIFFHRKNLQPCVGKSSILLVLDSIVLMKVAFLTKHLRITKEI